MLKYLQSQDMQARKLKLGTENLASYLYNTGEVCIKRLGKLVCARFISYGGTVIRAYGVSLKQVLLNICYQAFIVGRIYG